MARSADGGRDQQTILVVEHNPGDARLVKEICEEMGLGDLLHMVSTGAAALNFMNQQGEYATVPRPDLFILDWHLPHMEGKAVLEQLDREADHPYIPVIVTTESVSEREVHNIYELGANACITKPAGPDELKELIQTMEQFWLSAARIPRSE